MPPIHVHRHLENKAPSYERSGMKHHGQPAVEHRAGKDNPRLAESMPPASGFRVRLTGPAPALGTGATRPGGGHGNQRPCDDRRSALEPCGEGGRPGPLSSPITAGRLAMAMAMSNASLVPATAVPLPVDQSSSVACNRRPRMRQGSPSLGLHARRRAAAGGSVFEVVFSTDVRIRF